MATATAERTGKRLIESDRVEGTTVYDAQGNNVGSIKRIMIDKISGKVANWPTTSSSETAGTLACGAGVVLIAQTVVFRRAQA